MSGGLIESAQNVLVGVLELGRTRFELLGAELREELGRLATTVLGDQVTAAIADPSRLNFWIVGIAGLALASLAAFGHWWLGRSEGGKKK